MSTAELNTHAGDAASAPEAGGAAMEARIDSALQQVEQTRAQLDTFLHADAAPASQNDAGAVPVSPVEGLVQVFHNVSDGIGHFFRVLFGIPDPVLTEHDPQIAQIAHRLDMQVDELKQLQAVRHGAAETGANLVAHRHDSETGSPAASAVSPQVAQMRHEVIAAREMFHHLSERMHHAAYHEARHIFHEPHLHDAVQTVEAHLHDPAHVRLAHLREPVHPHPDAAATVDADHRPAAANAISFLPNTGLRAMMAEAMSGDITTHPLSHIADNKLPADNKPGGMPEAVHPTPAADIKPDGEKVAETGVKADTVTQSMSWLGDAHAALPASPTAQTAAATQAATAAQPASATQASGVAQPAAVAQAPVGSHTTRAALQSGSATLEAAHTAVITEAVKPVSDATHPSPAMETAQPAAAAEAAKPAAAEAAKPAEAATADSGGAKVQTAGDFDAPQATDDFTAA